MGTPEDRLLTVPNILSVARLACIPLFAWELLGAHRPYRAAEMLAVLGATDWVDGYVARRFGQVSTFGKVIDPVADRVLVGTAVVAGAVAGAIPVWLCLVVGLREALVSVAVLALAATGAPRIDVLWVGKAGTLALMFAFPLFLVAHSTAGWHPEARVLAWLFAAGGVALSWTAAASYLPVAKRARQAARVRSVP